MFLESGIPMKEIAQMIGYEDAYSFSKQYTKTYHIAPGSFRVNSARNGGYRL